MGLCLYLTLYAGLLVYEQDLGLLIKTRWCAGRYQFLNHSLTLSDLSLALSDLSRALSGLSRALSDLSRVLSDLSPDLSVADYHNE